MESYGAVERRRYPRLCGSFPVLVRSVDARREAFASDTALDNFSAGGLYVRLGQRVEPGTKLFAVVRLATAPRSWAPAPCVAVHGVVRRAEPQPEGRDGVGVAFTHHRFL